MLPITVAILLVRFGPTQWDTIKVPIVEPIPDFDQSLKQTESKPEVVLKSVNQQPTKATAARPVFGANRNSLTTEHPNAIDAKIGNTLAKDVDNETLKPEDADSLPTPTDEFLVSEMPAVLTEIRPEYPPDAKAKRLEGAVVASILIDQDGLVRQVQILEGPEIFRAPTLQALKQFRFRPAKVEGKSVAVRIRYTLRFRLE